MAECEVAAENTVFFKDRKTRLVVMGVVQIIIGGLLAIIAPLMIVTAAAMPKGGADSFDFNTIIFTTVFLITGAVWFMWMGAGSIMARRWARALILITSWIWLIIGSVMFVNVLLFFPTVCSSENCQIPKNAAAIVRYIQIIFNMIFYVITPGLFVLLYSGMNVKATCEYRNPKISWTDKCPLPVLAMCLLLATWAVVSPMAGIHKWTVPFFGIILSGTAGAIAVLAIALLYAYSAWGMYKLNISAWWVAMLTIVGWSGSMIVTLSNIDMITYYEKMGLSEQVIDRIRQGGRAGYMDWFPVIWAVAAIIYLLWIKRYFKSNSQENVPQDSLSGFGNE